MRKKQPCKPELQKKQSKSISRLIPPVFFIIPQERGAHKEVNKMKIEITGEPKEIAALVLAVQERQCEAVVETTDWAGNVAVVTEKS
jgi:hypothetical protein